MKPLELYIHIPFCVRKCKYCDFLSGPSTEAQRESYAVSLCRSIRSYEHLAKAYHVRSIFVGGGTPSTLTGEQMTRIFQSVRETFHIDTDAEITIEMNPGTVDEEKLDAYRACGINRLSIGLQSTDDHELEILGRIHSYADFEQTYQLVRRMGFANVNIDLMSAIPGQTLASWRRTLEKVIHLNPEHISAYSLIIEEGTPFYDLYGEGADKSDGLLLPDEETERQMYWETGQMLGEAGYRRYEISNYAKPGYECRHNLGYWDRIEYLGIGEGAASLIDNRRFVFGEEPESLDTKDAMEEYMFLGLRKIDGVSIERFEQLFGQPMEQIYGSVLRDMEEKGLLVKQKDTVKLTDHGLDVANYVMSEFIL